MDYRMPKLNGITACRYILAKDPNARVILISGWSAPVEPESSGAIAILCQTRCSAHARCRAYRRGRAQKEKEPAPVIVDATPLRAVDSAEPEAYSLSDGGGSTESRPTNPLSQEIHW